MYNSFLDVWNDRLHRTLQQVDDEGQSSEVVDYSSGLGITSYPKDIHSWYWRCCPSKCREFPCIWGLSRELQYSRIFSFSQRACREPSMLHNDQHVYYIPIIWRSKSVVFKYVFMATRTLLTIVSRRETGIEVKIIGKHSMKKETSSGTFDCN